MSSKLTTSQLFGLTPKERTALINTVAGEAYQQGGGKDIAAVTANLMSRRISNYGGMNNMVDLVMAPGQYAANFETSRDQIMNPGLISANDRDRIGKIVDNPSMVLSEYMAGGGPVSFRGTDLYKNRRGDEYTPIEGKSNFYFDPLKTSNPTAYQKGLDMFRSVVPATGYDQTPTQTAASAFEQTPTQTAAQALTTITLPDGTTISVGPNGVDARPSQKKKTDNPKNFITNYLTEQMFSQLQGGGNNSLVDELIKQAQGGGYISAKKAMDLFGGFE